MSEERWEVEAGDHGKLGSPGIGTAVLTLVAAGFALVTFGRDQEWVRSYPYLARFEDPGRAIFLRAEYERRIAQTWPAGVWGAVGSPDDAAEAWRALGDEIGRASHLEREDKQRLLDASIAGAKVVGAGWNVPAALAAVREENELNAPTYLRTRIREIQRGDDAPDRERAATARRWHLVQLLVDFLGMAATPLALGYVAWQRRATKSSSPERSPLRFGLGQAWVVLSWSFAALALAWRLAHAEVPLLSDIARAFPSLTFAAVGVVLVRDTRSTVVHSPLKRMFQLPREMGARLRWALLGVAAFGASLWFAYLVQYASLRLGMHSPWSEVLIEELLGGSRFTVLLTVIELIVFAPIGEELLFRGVLFGALTPRLGLHKAALVSALIFSVWHGYSVPGSMFLVFDAYLWALIYARTGSLVPGALAHSAINVSVCIANVACRA